MKHAADVISPCRHSYRRYNNQYMQNNIFLRYKVNQIGTFKRKTFRLKKNRRTF